MWSSYSPSTVRIRVQIPLKLSVLYVKFVFEKTKNLHKKRPGLANFLMTALLRKDEILKGTNSEA